jgi:hypothetical protein
MKTFLNRAVLRLWPLSVLLLVRTNANFAGFGRGLDGDRRRFTPDGNSSLRIRCLDINCLNQAFHRRGDKTFEISSAAAFTQQEIGIKRKFGSVGAAHIIAIELGNSDTLRQQIHFAIQIDSPQKSDVQEEVCGFTGDYPAEHSGTHDVLDYMILMC